MIREEKTGYFNILRQGKNITTKMGIYVSGVGILELGWQSKALIIHQPEPGVIHSKLKS